MDVRIWPSGARTRAALGDSGLGVVAARVWGPPARTPPPMWGVAMLVQGSPGQRTASSMSPSRAEKAEPCRGAAKTGVASCQETEVRG